MAYAYKRTITCGNATGGTQTDFPLLLKFDSSNVGTTFKTVGNGGHIQNTVTQSGGNAVTMPADLIFTSDSGGTTKIPWEVESYDGTNGVLWAWVKIASLTTSGATIYVFYDDATVSTQQNTGSYSPSNVWDSNFKGVYHLPDGTTLSATDSTSNAHNGTITNATATTGQVDGGGNFTGGNSSISVTSTTALQLGNNLTLEAWVNPTTVGSAYQAIITKGSSRDYAFFLSEVAANQIYVSIGATVLGNVTLSSSVTANAWNHIVLTKDASNNLIIYLNGSNVLSTTNPNIGTSTDNLYFGRELGSQFPLTGKLDEIRLSNSTRSANWITTEYNNQSSPLTFNTIGAETSTGGTTTRYDLLLINVGT